MDGSGYYTILMNEESNELNWDGLSRPPEEQVTPAVEVTPTVRPSQKRTKNFSEKEDEILVSAWLNISMDAIQGTDQSRSTYWKRIFYYFHSNKDFTSDRSQKSLLHRWSAIQENVNKFAGCLSRIEGRKQSGVSYQDKLVQACTLFKSEDKTNKSFQFMHCWNLLRTQPKWIDRQTQKPPHKKQKTADTPICPDESEAATPEYSVTKRPIGKKRGKEKLRQGGDLMYMEALDNLWTKKKEADAEKELKKDERYKQVYALEQERVAIEKENLELKSKEFEFKRMLEEERIMSIDISGMSDPQ